MTIRITPDQTATITATFEDLEGNAIEVTGNPDWYVITNHPGKYRELKLVQIFPNGAELLVVPTGLMGTATIVACIYYDDISPLDPEANRICNTIDVVINSKFPDTNIKLDDEKLDDGPGELVGPVPLSLRGGVTAVLGISIPPAP